MTRIPGSEASERGRGARALRAGVVAAVGQLVCTAVTARRARLATEKPFSRRTFKQFS